MFRRIAVSLSLGLLPFAVHAAASLDEAVALFQAHRYPEARSAFEQIVAREPANAAAAYYLGLAWKLRSDSNALEEAVKWLGKAAELAPNNARYLADLGGTALELASRTRSLTAALKGRDAMEKSLTLDPENLDSREGLFEFYAQAPWPLGSSAKAAAQLDEIRKRDPAHATALGVRLKADAKDYAAAFTLCDDLLAKNPTDYTALYQYGRTAAISGQNLDRGLAHLKRCLTLERPGPAAPAPTYVWNRIGNICEKLGRAADARAAYETALKLDANNAQAASALARLK